MKKIATVINYCSNDRVFLKECLYQVRKFADEIIVVVADHLFNGEKENIDLLVQDFSKFDFAKFIIYPFIPDEIPKRIFKKVKKNSFFHSLSRYIASFYLKKDIAYVLFLDVDEIVDGDRFKLWLDANPMLDRKKFGAHRLANYWYFKSASLRAETLEDSPVLVNRKNLKNKFLLDSRERDAIFDQVKGEKKRLVLGLDNLPLVHHFSWVKTKEQMLKKVKSWGHRDDKNWEELIEKEFNSPNMNKDFVHGYNLKKVAPFIDIDLEKDEIIEECGAQLNKDNIYFLTKEKLLKLINKRSFKDHVYCFIEKKMGVRF